VTATTRTPWSAVRPMPSLPGFWGGGRQNRFSSSVAMIRSGPTACPGEPPTHDRLMVEGDAGRRCGAQRGAGVQGSQL